MNTFTVVRNYSLLKHHRFGLQVNNFPHFFSHDDLYFCYSFSLGHVRELIFLDTFSCIYILVDEAWSDFQPVGFSKYFSRQNPNFNMVQIIRNPWGIFSASLRFWRDPKKKSVALSSRIPVA